MLTLEEVYQKLLCCYKSLQNKDAFNKENGIIDSSLEDIIAIAYSLIRQKRLITDLDLSAYTKSVNFVCNKTDGCEELYPTINTKWEGYNPTCEKNANGENTGKLIYRQLRLIYISDSTPVLDSGGSFILKPNLQSDKDFVSPIFSGCVCVGLYPCGDGPFTSTTTNTTSTSTSSSSSTTTNNAPICNNLITGALVDCSNPLFNTVTLNIGYTGANNITIETHLNSTIVDVKNNLLVVGGVTSFTLSKSISGSLIFKGIYQTCIKEFPYTLSCPTTTTTSTTSTSSSSSTTTNSNQCAQVIISRPSIEEEPEILNLRYRLCDLNVTIFQEIGIPKNSNNICIDLVLGTLEAINPDDEVYLESLTIVPGSCTLSTTTYTTSTTSSTSTTTNITSTTSSSTTSTIYPDCGYSFNIYYINNITKLSLSVGVSTSSEVIVPFVWEILNVSLQVLRSGIELTGARNLVYDEIPDGFYTLRVKGFNCLGATTNQNFTLLTPTTTSSSSTTTAIPSTSSSTSSTTSLITASITLGSPYCDGGTTTTSSTTTTTIGTTSTSTTTNTSTTSSSTTTTGCPKGGDIEVLYRNKNAVGIDFTSHAQAQLAACAYSGTGGLGYVNGSITTGATFFDNITNLCTVVPDGYYYFRENNISTGYPLIYKTAYVLGGIIQDVSIFTCTTSTTTSSTTSTTVLDNCSSGIVIRCRGVYPTGLPYSSFESAQSAACFTGVGCDGYVTSIALGQTIYQKTVLPDCTPRPCTGLETGYYWIYPSTNINDVYVVHVTNGLIDQIGSNPC